MINMEARKLHRQVRKEVFPKPAMYELQQSNLKDAEQYFLNCLWPCITLTLKAALKQQTFRCGV